MDHRGELVIGGEDTEFKMVDIIYSISASVYPLFIIMCNAGEMSI